MSLLCYTLLRHVIEALTRARRPIGAKGVQRGMQKHRKREGNSPKSRLVFLVNMGGWIRGGADVQQVDAVFYSRLSVILRIIIPNLRSKEALLLAMHSSLLVFRTVISLYVAALDGK